MSKRSISLIKNEDDKMYEQNFNNFFYIEKR